MCLIQSQWLARTEQVLSHWAAVPVLTQKEWVVFMHAWKL